MSDRPYLRDAVVLGLAVGVFGLSFGVLAVTAGLTVVQACAMSLLVFTGGSQFAAVGVVESGGTAAAAVGSALLLAARNAAYAVSLAPVLGQGSLGRRLVAAQLVIDESTALAVGQGDARHRAGAFWAAGVSVFVCWNVATLVGALAGGAIGDPATFGLDAAFPAGFLALMAPHLRARRGQVAALVGGGVALALVPLAPAGVPVIAATAAVIPALLFVPDRGSGGPGPEARGPGCGRPGAGGLGGDGLGTHGSGASAPARRGDDGAGGEEGLR